MPHFLRAIACIWVLLPMAASHAWGVGLGRVDDATVLGGPLDFSVALHLGPGEVLGSNCVSAEVVIGENRVASSLVHVFLQRASDATVQAVRVRTDARVDEPVATITLKVGCPARLVRQFVALVDPPPLQADAVAMQTDAGGPALQDVSHDASIAAQLRAAAAGSAASAVAGVGLPGVGEEPGRASRRRNDASTAAPKRQRFSATRAGQPDPAASKPVAAGAARRPPVLAARPAADSASRVPAASRNETAERTAAKAGGAPVSRLSLDPPAPVAIASAPSSASAAASSAAANAQDAAASVPPSQDRALSEGRLASLEASLNKLQAENEANRARMLALQARLLQAESARYANPLVFVLLCLVLLMGVALVFMFKRQRRSKQRPPWWGAPVMPSSHADSSWQSRFDDPVPPMTPQDVWPIRPPTLSSSRPTVPPPPSSPSPTEPMPLAAGPADASGSSLEPPKRPVAVEELIDLEQQAEFFRVLGQEQSAIDLLMSHLDESGASSPMPYLKLLDIHRRRGGREDYEHVRARFNERFSAYAPEWGADLGAGQSLESYREVLTELQRLWGAPRQAMERLETLLFRRDDEDTTFELPAYLQLLFLFSVARDLAETEIDPGMVDLLLPLGPSDSRHY